MELCDLKVDGLCAIRYLTKAQSKGGGEGALPGYVLCVDELTNTRNPAVDDGLKPQGNWWAFTRDRNEEDGSFEVDADLSMSRDLATAEADGWTSALSYQVEGGNDGRFLIYVFAVNTFGEYNPEETVQGIILLQNEFADDCEYNHIDVCCDGTEEGTAKWTGENGELYTDEEGKCQEFAGEQQNCKADMYPMAKRYDRAPKFICGWGSTGAFTTYNQEEYPAYPTSWEGDSSRRLAARDSARQLKQDDSDESSCEYNTFDEDMNALWLWKDSVELSSTDDSYIFTGISPGLCCHVAVVAYNDDCEVYDVKECCADIEYTPVPTIEPSCECPEMAGVTCGKTTTDEITVDVECPDGFSCSSVASVAQGK